MPDMDGIEVLKELKARSPELPVLLVSGYSQDPLPDDLASTRHDGFLTKPFSLEQFREIMAALELKLPAES